MLIRVQFHNGKFGMVKPYLLDKLLKKNKVASFLRSDGWVIVGRDPVRSSCNSQYYCGKERRDRSTISDLLKRETATTSLLEVTGIIGISILVFIMLSGFMN